MLVARPGDFVITELHASNTKVTGDIVSILYPPQIKHLKETNMWSVRRAEHRPGQRLRRGLFESMCLTVGVAAGRPSLPR